MQYQCLHKQKKMEKKRIGKKRSTKTKFVTEYFFYYSIKFEEFGNGKQKKKSKKNKKKPKNYGKTDKL